MNVSNRTTFGRAKGWHNSYLHSKERTTGPVASLVMLCLQSVVRSAVMWVHCCSSFLCLDKVWLTFSDYITMQTTSRYLWYCLRTHTQPEYDECSSGMIKQEVKVQTLVTHVRAVASLLYNCVNGHIGRAIKTGFFSCGNFNIEGISV